MKNYFNYFTEIEEYFIRKRGRNLLVSPLDWCLIELWQENEIPLHVVLRGIDQSFESAQGRRGRAPTTLFYCHPAVLQAFEEYRQSMLGQAEQPAREASSREKTDLPRNAVLEHLTRLAESLKALKRSELRASLARLQGLLQEVRETPSPDYRRLDQELNRIAAEVAAILADELPDKQAAALRQEAKKDLQRYKKRLSSEMYARLRASYEQKKIREIFQVPEFTLFELGR